MTGAPPESAAKTDELRDLELRMAALERTPTPPPPATKTGLAEQPAELPKPGAKTSEYRDLLYTKALTAVSLGAYVLLHALGLPEPAEQVMTLTYVIAGAAGLQGAAYATSRAIVKSKAVQNGGGR